MSAASERRASEQAARAHAKRQAEKAEAERKANPIKVPAKRTDLRSSRTRDRWNFRRLGRTVTVCALAFGGALGVAGTATAQDTVPVYITTPGHGQGYSYRVDDGAWVRGAHGNRTVAVPRGSTLQLVATRAWCRSVASGTQTAWSAGGYVYGDAYCRTS